MSDHREVRVENPMLCAQFTDWLLRQGAPLPWNFGAIIGEIVDAEDRVVFHVSARRSSRPSTPAEGSKYHERARQRLPALPRRRL